jgi:hypothetical protein
MKKLLAAGFYPECNEGSLRSLAMLIQTRYAAGSTLGIGFALPTWPMPKAMLIQTQHAASLRSGLILPASNLAHAKAMFIQTRHAGSYVGIDFARFQLGPCPKSRHSPVRLACAPHLVPTWPFTESTIFFVSQPTPSLKTTSTFSMSSIFEDGSPFTIMMSACLPAARDPI